MVPINEIALASDPRNNDVLHVPGKFQIEQVQYQDSVVRIDKLRFGTASQRSYHLCSLLQIWSHVLITNGCRKVSEIHRYTCTDPSLLNDKHDRIGLPDMITRSDATGIFERQDTKLKINMITPILSASKLRSMSLDKRLHSANLSMRNRKECPIVQNTVTINVQSPAWYRNRE